MSVDQDPLFDADVTYRRIDPSTQVDRMPGINAICECTFAGIARADPACRWPFCDPLTEEDE